MKTIYLLLLVSLGLLNMSYAAEKNEKYVLATGDKARERLELQNNLLTKDAYVHLEKAKLSKDMIVWDIGCGVGAMTSYLADKVGPNGHVYALDISQEQLDVAEKSIKSKGFQNVTFIKGDINELENLPKKEADLVYMRFVLMHLTHPENALKKITNLLKKGGIVVSQESIMSTITQGKPVIDDYINIVMALGHHKKVDYDIGNRLEDLYKKNGFNPVKVYYNQQKISTTDLKKMLLMGLSEWKNKAIEINLLTADKVTAWENEIEAIPTDDPNLMFSLAKQAHVLAWK
jgi:ubiquinone/menaquinone biosynthesis C-methylase UbiE